MNIILAILLYVFVTFSNTVPDSDRYYLCNGLEVNNTDHAATTEYADLWVIHFSFDDPLTYVIIFDSCMFNYRAYEISLNGIERVEF